MNNEITTDIEKGTRMYDNIWRQLSSDLADHSKNL